MKWLSFNADNNTQSLCYVPNAGVPLAVCSTSNERSVSAVVNVLLGPELGEKIRIFAGDVVPKKKPDPAIYLLAAKELSVEPSRCGRLSDPVAGIIPLLPNQKIPPKKLVLLKEFK